MRALISFVLALGVVYCQAQQKQEIKYAELERLPSFKGGMSAFDLFIINNLKYPIEARKNNVQGKVVVGFVIEKDGSVTETRVIKGIGSGCDEEALRVINESPKWIPGLLLGGKPVRVSYTIPIIFQLGPQKTEVVKEKLVW
jgi:TonB family protein